MLSVFARDQSQHCARSIWDIGTWTKDSTHAAVIEKLIVALWYHSADDDDYIFFAERFELRNHLRNDGSMRTGES